MSTDPAMLYLKGTKEGGTGQIRGNPLKSDIEN